MSKWCGDENCLQCADKEPDPYVHLPRADYEALREQNRVLRSNLVNCVARLEAYYGEDYPAVRDAKAALTATSQPTSKKGDFPHHPAFDEYGEHR